MPLARRLALNQGVPGSTVRKADMLAGCLHGLTALAPHDMAALIAAMLLAGLAGSVTHCAGMCGPFVVAQIADDPRGGHLARLCGAALLPYHAGRALGYSGLGALAGSAARLISLASWRGVLAVPLAFAALVMLGQAAARLPVPEVLQVRLPMPPAGLPGLARLGRLLNAPVGRREEESTPIRIHLIQPGTATERAAVGTVFLRPRT